MSKIGKVDIRKGKRLRVSEITHAEWRIPEFFSVTEYKNDSYNESPTFSVAGVSFFFRLYPRNSIHPEAALCYLKSDFVRGFSVEYVFGLKKLDGSVEQLQGGIIQGKESCGASTGYLYISDLLLRKAELVPGNVLTLTCTFKPETVQPTETTELENPKELKLISKLDKLSQNFKDLFGYKETCDVTLKVRDKEYKAHRSVLIARSSVFAATFKHDTLEKQTGIITISDCDADSFMEFLEYLYCGKLEVFSFYSALNLYYTANKYDVEDLKIYCLEYLMQSLTVENICEVVVFADKYEEVALFSAVQDCFNRNVGDILVTSDWECLMKTNYRLANKLLIEMPKVKYED